MEYGRYGIIGVGEDFSLDLDDRLERIRDEYNRRLMEYYKDHQPRTYLISKHCELRLIKDITGICFYCKEKPHGNKKGRFFEVKGDSAHASTMWSIIDMEFNKQTNYNSVKSLYFRLNQTSNTIGGLRYFYESFFKKYPDFDEYSAQNEYCRMELMQREKCIICSEIWANNPKKFAISGNKYLLLNIIDEFKKEDKKFQGFAQLFAKYSIRKDITVDLITTEMQENQQVVQKQEQQVSENNVQIVPDDVNNNDEEIKKFDDINKYNERNLDL